MRYKNILVTGGSGFIGSAFILFALDKVNKIVNLDLLTYAAQELLIDDLRYHFVYGDICNEALVEALCLEHKIDAIVHCAAESHVDRSITSPKTFLKTNVEGTVALLEVVRRHPSIHFHHISTDEVYGSSLEGRFHEGSPYKPNSPYAASKAASDHFVRAYQHTYGLSTTISHCTNNYGPRQFPEKLIPLMILNCLKNKPLPIYGNGLNVRDWIFVEDHAEAIFQILQYGIPGEVYGVSAEVEKSNVQLISELIQEVARATSQDLVQLEQLITYVTDRPGHDKRYAIDSTKIRKELGWRPRCMFAEGLRRTINWYINASFNLHSNV